MGGMRRHVALFAGLLALVVLANAATVLGASAPRPVSHGALSVTGTLRDGGTVQATGLTWTHSRLAPGQRLLSFGVTYTWLRCTTRTGPCVAAAAMTRTPFAASHYIVGHGDVGRYLRLTETAIQVIETDPATFGFRVNRAVKSFTTARKVTGYQAGKAPTSAFINGLPEARTGSHAENFALAPPHFAAADGAPTVDYRLDGGTWTRVPASQVIATTNLSNAAHTLAVRTQNTAGSTSITFHWTVHPLAAAVACTKPGGCWLPPHLDSTGHPLRWDWQIGRVTPLQRTGARAVDMYDIDGFLTTAAQVSRIHTSWQASTLPHPKVACYLDLAWENYRPDGSPTPWGTAFPARTLGRIYYGYANERWVDFRQLHALEPMIDARIAMCQKKGFDAVELDDIESYDSPTGFHLTPGDAQNFLAYVDNDVHRHGMSVLWKNTGLLSWWGRHYTDGAVVEECYTFSECFTRKQIGRSEFGITCTNLAGPRPCGWDDFTTDTTPAQPNGKWVGEIEYGDDGFVCNPGAACTGERSFATYCKAIYAPSYGFSAAKLDVDLDGKIFFPCPSGR